MGSLFRELQEHELELNRLKQNEQKCKTKKVSKRAATSSIKDNEEIDSDDEEINLLIEDVPKFLKKNKKLFKDDEVDSDDEEKNLFTEYLLKKNKKSFKEGKKDPKKRGSSSTCAMP